MTMKKIMAGVLAVASVLSVSATAFAAPAAPDNTKEITAPGSAEYEAGVGMMGAELSVELPAQMKAFLNPYGAEVAITDQAVAPATDPATSKEGIVSWAYEVVNNTEDFGIMIDVKAAKATVGTGITMVAPGSVTDGSSATDKQVALVLQAGATAEDATTYDAAKTATTPANATDQGIFVFETTEKSKSKIAYVPAKAKTDTTGKKVYLGLTGEINKQYTSGADTEDLEWTEDDTITAAYTLKINPSAKTQADAFNGAGGGGVTSNVAPLTALSFANGALGSITFTAPADFTAASSKTLTGTATQSSGIIQVTPTFTVGAGHTVTGTVVSGGTGTLTNGTQATITGVTAGTDLVINFVTDDGSGNGTTYTLTLTVS